MRTAYSDRVRDPEIRAFMLLLVRGVMVSSLGVSVAYAQSMAGTWESKAITRSGKPTITVIIDESAENVKGKVILVNRNGSEIKMAILNAKVSGGVLKFQTKGPSSFDWHITFAKDPQLAFLRLSFAEGAMQTRLTRKAFTAPVQ